MNWHIIIIVIYQLCTQPKFKHDNNINSYCSLIEKSFELTFILNKNTIIISFVIASELKDMM